MNRLQYIAGAIADFIHRMLRPLVARFAFQSGYCAAVSGETPQPPYHWSEFGYQYWIAGYDQAIIDLPEEM